VWFIDEGRRYVTLLNQRVDNTGHWSHVAVVSSVVSITQGFISNGICTDGVARFWCEE